MYEKERQELIDKLSENGITDIFVLKAINEVERHKFIPEVLLNHAYYDVALPIGYGQTISQPYTVAFMTQSLRVKPDSKILEIGTGSGYQAAILYRMGANVYSIERQFEIHERTRKLLDKLEIRVNTKCGDGTIGWEEFAPYDGILVTAGSPSVPVSLKKQLAVNGRLVIPVGDRVSQRLKIVTKITETEFETLDIPEFVFVPLIGKEGWTPVVIVIVGPTCSGKTALAIDVALKLKTEIISADSRQVYKYLNIGTAKPNELELKNIKHHFIDVLNPDEKYNASKFSVEASKVITRLQKEGKIPIVAGGSGLYIKALIDGIIDEVEVDEVYRNELYEVRRKYGNEHLYNELKKVDPESASKMLPQNWKRVIRALEVFHITKKPIGYFHSVQQQRCNYIFKQYGLDWDRKSLYENINIRVDKMINNGLVDEVKSILSLGFDKKINALNTVGYKEIISYLENEISLDSAIELIKSNTRHFAKRQLTWFRKDKRILWFKISHQSELEQISQNIIQSLH